VPAGCGQSAQAGPGKGLRIYGVTLDEIRILHKELKLNGVVYCPDAKSATEARKIMTWLERNT